MDGTTFKKIVEKVSFFPGWRLSVKHSPGKPDPRTRVLLECSWTGLDTDRELAREGYPETRELYRSEVHDVRLLESELDVYRTLVAFLGRVWTHEAREALRLPEQDWEAPFHPHRPETIADWRETEDLSVPLETVDR